MAKCVKCYEGIGFQLAKSEVGNWFVRKWINNSPYGSHWSKWVLFGDKVRVQKTAVQYENMNGNEIRENIFRVYNGSGSDCLDLVNGEVVAVRESNFRLPERD